MCFVFTQLSMKKGMEKDETLSQFTLVNYVNEITQWLLQQPHRQFHCWLPDNLIYDHFIVHEEEMEEMKKLIVKIASLKNCDTEKSQEELQESQTELKYLKDTAERKKKNRTDVLQYMNNLIKNFNIPVFNKNTNSSLNNLCQILKNLCPNHFINQWLLSVYIVKNDETIDDINYHYSKSLSFPNGFELLFVFNTCILKNVLVYVNNCVLQCDSIITGIQLHKHKCNSIRIIGQVPQVVCFLLRRVPIIQE